MPHAKKIKNLFLKGLIISLSASGLIGIFIFLFGEFGDTEVKLLMTTLSVGICSLTGLCCASIYSSAKYRKFSMLGIATAGLCFLFSLAAIWSNPKDIQVVWKIQLTILVLSITFAHISLLLNIKPTKKLVKFILIFTLLFISIVAAMLLLLIFGGFEDTDFFFRLLGVFAILDVLGTIITPILNRTQKEGTTQ
jgi:hypothetical protein